MLMQTENYSSSLPGIPGQFLHKMPVRVHKILFANEDSGYAVAKVRPHAGGPEFVLVGVVGDMHEGATVKVAGKWTQSKYGTQLEVTEIDMPDLQGEGVVDFLKAGFVKGIGPKLAEELWNHFGTQLFDILENDCGRLVEVKGIGKSKIETIKQSWDEVAGKREALAEFQKMGLHVGIVRQLFKLWPPSLALRLVKENPYMLLWRVSGVGFATADSIGLKLGIPKDSMMRLGAALHYALTLSESEGHCYLPEDDLIRKTLSELNLNVSATRIGEALDLMEAEKQICRDMASGVCLAYRQATYNAEVFLANHLLRLAGRKQKPIDNLPESLSKFEAKLGIKLHPSQRRAVEMAFAGSVCVITGGPGTGKTTIIRAILETFRGSMPKSRINLCAPTGRAAKRMEETSNMEASTIHRLLGFSPGEGFLHNYENPLSADMLICDESSMLDVHLARSLVAAIRDGARLVFVGDVDQLPSVGPGNVLRDIIQSAVIPTVKLEQVYRQSEGSFISLNAAAVLDGRYEDIRFDKTEDFFWAGVNNPRLEPDEKADGIITLLVSCVRRLQELNYKPQDVMILCPMRKGKLGVANLNRVLQPLYNPSSVPFYRGKDRQFCVGDRVMQTKNNYDKEVFNGDQGVIIDANDKEAIIDFDGRHVNYPRQDFGEITLAYAMTVHKSQGSESRAVIVVLAQAHYMMLQRSILYTAITRAKERCVLIGEMAAVKKAVSCNNVAQRCTYLEKRLSAA